MACDKCGKDSESARSFTWVVLPRRQRFLEFVIPGIKETLLQGGQAMQRYEITYEPLERLRISLCPRCFAQARGWQTFGLATLMTVFLVFLEFFLIYLAMYGALPSAQRDRPVLVGAAVLCGGIAVAAGSLVVMLFQRHGTGWETENVLEGRFMRELTRREAQDQRGGTMHDWHYMTLDAFSRFLAGRGEPLSRADCEAFIRSSRKVGPVLAAADRGQPVEPAGK